MKKIHFFLVCSFLLSSAYSQQKKITVWAMPEIGLAAGALNPAADFRFNAGIHVKSWDFSAGLAFDEYRDPSYPVFLQARRHFKWRKWHPVLFGSAGYNIRSGTDTIPTWFGNRSETYRGGLFAEAGMGLVLKIRKSERLFLGIYQSYKRSSTTFQEFRWTGPGNVVTVPSTEIQRMHRLGIRAGWLIGK